MTEQEAILARPCSGARTGYGGGQMTAHTHDSQCTLDADNTCTGCGAYHDYPCDACGGRAYHDPDCWLERDRRITEARLRDLDLAEARGDDLCDQRRDERLERR